MNDGTSKVSFVIGFSKTLITSYLSFNFLVKLYTFVLKFLFPCDLLGLDLFLSQNALSDLLLIICRRLRLNKRGLYFFVINDAFLVLPKKNKKSFLNLGSTQREKGDLKFWTHLVRKLKQFLFNVNKIRECAWRHSSVVWGGGVGWKAFINRRYLSRIHRRTYRSITWSVPALLDPTKVLPPPILVRSWKSLCLLSLPEPGRGTADVCACIGRALGCPSAGVPGTEDDGVRSLLSTPLLPLPMIESTKSNISFLDEVPLCRSCKYITCSIFGIKNSPQV